MGTYTYVSMFIDIIFAGIFFKKAFSTQLPDTSKQSIQEHNALKIVFKYKQTKKMILVWLFWNKVVI